MSNLTSRSRNYVFKPAGEWVRVPAPKPRSTIANKRAAKNVVLRAPILT